MTFSKKLATAVVSGALLLNSFATPAFAATIQITGNGDSSNNSANVSVNNSTNVVQNNVANITNNVDAGAQTGGNTANRNNGGNVTIDTGNANTTVNLTTKANANVASLGCCNQGNNVSVNISGNAADTNNTAGLGLNNAQDVFQNNVADVLNKVDANSKTGNNDANRNNGGTVAVVTGNADTNVTVHNATNLNAATVGSGAGTGNTTGGNLGLWILGNGDSSNNNIYADVASASVLSQDNVAYLANNIDANAKTGSNDANRNNGGSVIVDTGNANTTANVDNAANFNFASSDCGCLLGDWTAKIGGNAADTSNGILLDLTAGKDVFQNNVADLSNKLHNSHANTGNNDANSNNGGLSAGSDPLIVTGNGNSDTNVNNSVNLNNNGSSALDFPQLPNLQLGASIDWTMLFGWLGVHSH